MKRTADQPVADERSNLRRILLVCLCAMCAAPTPGDIGGCGTPPRLLDGEKFFTKKQELDCAACRSCDLSSNACELSCDEALIQSEFPEGCFPLVFDGEVCLRALSYSTCDDYAAYMSDAAPSIPTECDFCPGEQP